MISKFAVALKIIKLVAMNLAVLLIISACTSSRTNNALDSVRNRAMQNEQQNADLDRYCPNSTVRAGTGTLRTFPKGVKKSARDSDEKLRFQATIREVVRECNYISQTLAMRVGIAGVVTKGPAAKSNEMELPIRVVVTRGKEVLYSRLHKVASKMERGRRQSTFRFVDEAVNIDKPDQQNILIYVGFDEGPYNTP